ncbi:ATP-binding cassette domain-containing protein, partial [Rhodococcus ruber]|uniref:ATP-binding cassette domain-containing protein n=1 Tax=Rhodococcus ruber TaxID=1830 RepID=UPI0024B6E7E5
MFSGLDLTVTEGDVIGLVGANGAGKSTLIKAQTGVYSIDSGTVTIDGTEHEFATPSAAQAAGISTVYQEVNLLPN